jgi:hypothetical protein
VTRGGRRPLGGRPSRAPAAARRRGVTRPAVVRLSSESRGRSTEAPCVGGGGRVATSPCAGGGGRVATARAESHTREWQAHVSGPVGSGSSEFNYFWQPK